VLTKRLLSRSVSSPRADPPISVIGFAPQKVARLDHFFLAGATAIARVNRRQLCSGSSCHFLALFVASCRLLTHLGTFWSEMIR
jgi:hypothetical protein